MRFSGSDLKQEDDIMKAMTKALALALILCFGLSLAAPALAITFRIEGSFSSSAANE